uniref:NADAR domain-containing protein n=1 Tax=Angiostrongylus cantonensis TaxID=6313 RepID=A0A0K0DK48_ANGCA
MFSDINKMFTREISITVEYMEPVDNSRALFSRYRQYNPKPKPWARKIRGQQPQKVPLGKRKSSGRFSVPVSSSSTAQVCKAEDTPHSDDQKPGRIRSSPEKPGRICTSPEKPDISVLKIISPKNSTKQLRKLQPGSSDAKTKKVRPSSNSGVRRNMSYVPFGAGMPRGGYAMMRGGRNGRSYGRRYIMKPNNNPMDIPFAPLPDDSPAITLSIDPDNFICFHGFSSIFTTQHTFPVLIEGKIYESGDHYYQIQKVHDLCGTVSDRLTETVRDDQGRRLDGKVGFNERRDKSFSQIAKEVIRLNNVDKKKVDEWRYSKGLEIMQKVLLAKVIAPMFARCLTVRDASSGFIGKWCRHAQVRKWCESMKANGATIIRIPATFPLTTESVVNCPNFAQGRNVLGVILMQLREMLRENKVPIVDLGSVFDTLRIGSNNVDATMDDQVCESYHQP